MASKKWYANVYVLLVFFISTTAVLMASLTLLLLPQSSEIVRLAQWRLMRARTLGVEGLIRYEGWQETKKDNGAVDRRREVVNFETVGSVDRTDAEAAKADLRFDLAVGAKPVEYTGQYVKIGNADFLKFESLPAMLGALKLEPLRGGWLTFDIENIRAGLDSPFWGGSGRELDEVDQAYLLDQLRVTPFLKYLGRLKTETIGGVPNYHYVIHPELLYVKDYILQAEALRLGRELTSKERDPVDVFFANVKAEDGEIWIGKRDLYLYRALLRFRYDDGLRRGTLAVTLNFSNFNKPVSIAAPEGDVEPIDQIITSLLPTISEHLPLAGKGAMRRGAAETATKGLPVFVSKNVGDDDPDKDGLPNSLEHFYGTDPNNPDTDGDGMLDGEEVEKGLNPNGPGKLFDFGIEAGLK